MITILANCPSRTRRCPARHDSLRATRNLATPPTDLGGQHESANACAKGRARVNGEDALAQLGAGRIAHAVFDQSVHRLEQVFRRVPSWPRALTRVLMTVSSGSFPA